MPTKPKKAAAGPSYADLIKSAIVALKERGSSRQAINKFVSAKKGSNFKSGVFNRALKSGVEKGTLIQVKGSFKLAAAAKKAAKKKAPKKKKAAPKKKKTATKKKAAPKKKTSAKKKKTTKKKTATKKKKAAPKKKVRSVQCRSEADL